MEDIRNFETKAIEWINSQRKTLKQSTYSCYYRIITKKIIPYFNSYSLEDINKEKILNFVSYLSECEYSHKYICDVLSVLKMLLEGNGVYLDFHSAKKKIAHLQSKRNPKILSIYQQRKFINLLMTENDIRAIGCLISLYTGIRIGEICALRCKDIDKSAKTITIKHTMQRIQKVDESRQTEVIIDSPKSISSNRIIPIPNCLCDLIFSIISEPENYILTGKPDKYIEPRNMQNYISKLYAILNIKGLSYHSLRHTFATRCLEIKFDLKSLSEILGHSSVNTTLNLYVHPSLQTKRKHMNKLTF